MSAVGVTPGCDDAAMAWWYELPMVEQGTWSHPGIPEVVAGELRGRPLRYLLTLRLYQSKRRGEPSMSVAELVRACERAGVVFRDRPSKTVSDALRWEIRNGRVRRVGRGAYTSGHIPPSTLSWIRKRVERSLERVRNEVAQADARSRAA